MNTISLAHFLPPLLMFGCSDPAILSLSSGALPAGRLGANYEAAIEVSGGAPPYTLAVVEGALPRGITINGLTLAGTPTMAGLERFVLEASDAGGGRGRARYSLAIEPDPIMLSVIAPLSVVEGEAVSRQLQASGGVPPLVFRVVGDGAPWPGLSLDEGGLLHGAATVVGAGAVSIRVTDGALQGVSATLGITVSSASPMIATSTLPRAHQGMSYDFSIETSGGTLPLSFGVAEERLPAGLSLSPSGQISGVPSDVGRAHVGVRVVDAEGRVDARSYVLEVLGPLLIGTRGLSSAAAGRPYADVMSASGGLPPYHWTAIGALPAGLALNSDGSFQGSPSTLGEFPLTIKVEDAEGASRSARYVLRVGQRFSHELTPALAFPAVCTSTRVSYQTVEIDVPESAAITELDVTLDVGFVAPRPIEWKILLYAPDGRWAAICGDGAGIPGGGTCPSRGVHTSFPRPTAPDTSFSVFEGMNARGRWRLLIGVVHPIRGAVGCEPEGILNRVELLFGDDRSSEPYVVLGGYTTNNRVTDPFVRVRGGHQTGPVDLSLNARLMSAGPNGIREGGLGDDVPLVADFTFVGTDLPRGTTVSAAGQVSAGRVTGEGTVVADDGQGHRVERRLLVTPPDWNDLIRSY